MKRTKFFGVLALMIILAALGTASAYRGNVFGMDSESREDIVNAIETNNYQAWKEVMSNQLTEENFNDCVERHEARSEMREHREDKRQAIEAGDYKAFKVAAENLPVLSNIQNEDDFEMLVQLHQAKLDGDYETVAELREQLGLPGRFGEHKMSGQSGRGR
ncbi:MAG: hypothetical protein HF976_14355 [ANME-2 cluster archaeon]|nr:hypothetical protein [ANME-2 cluster archaeon]MBC2702555.1 hypothetical protein [ANME-2 cluster archaeon]MBC2708902.1 hypothetical protein [ANME-2 cluster archaeon]